MGNRIWSKITPSLVKAGRAAAPRAARVILNPFNRNKEAGLKGVAKNFGKDLVNNLLPGTIP